MTIPDYGAPPCDEHMFRRASASRISHLLVGGDRDAYPADTDLRDKLLDAFPRLEEAARIGRIHRTLTARHLAQHGYRQFLDLGCGYPAPYPNNPDIHHLIHPLHPGATVVYVDADRVALAHARAWAGGAAGVHHVLADLRRLPDLLDDIEEITGGTLRRDVPIAVLAHDVRPWIPGNAPDLALTRLRTWLPAGSALSITHATADLGQEVMSKLTSAYEEAGIHYLPRPRTVIADMFGEWPQQGPGLQPVARWHTDHPDKAAPKLASAAYAGIAVKPSGRP
ncbi:SAM-dependent methyltransferase [Streptomyces virginiae]|uniref:SAM-dependent methyltransferase n=1 Tax=Streptomyces virginiae TaxID=1961 RepID=UPI003245E0C1